ncbi:MAG TPA: pentapeptide repeat-containing protein [Cycloclasticus sp.]|nr:pentapeptide repeat-containing protein [Cycloclasticus sp.]
MLENKQNEMYDYLQDDNVDAFNKGLDEGKPVDLTNVKFRAFDLRGAKLSGLDLSGAYFKNADLRGADLSNSKLDGCSFFNAKISGVLFPDNVTPEEITRSLIHGTRVRVRR